MLHLLVLVLAQDVVYVASCGERQSSSRIVGGVIANAEQYPWYVALIPATDSGTSLNVYCGATLISGTHLLTAGHCFNGVPVGRQKDAYRPTFILENRCTSTYKSVSRVSKVAVHPQFNPNSLRNDIAVMTLSEPVSYTPACLPPANPYFATGPRMRGDATIVGYGNTLQKASKYPCELQEATVRLFTRNECLRTGNLPEIYNLPNIFCAGLRAGGVDTCDGDSGGPLLRVNANGKFYIQGITSFGNGCARRNNPGVYTDVSKYLNWIKKNTGIIV